jgi:GNAT superfamily N-acetyltransferase
MGGPRSWWRIVGQIAAAAACPICVEADREFLLDLRRPLVPWPAPAGVTISIASSQQVVEAAEMQDQHGRQEIRAEYEDRMRRGHKCFVAFKAGHVVGCNWLVFEIEQDGPLTIVLRPDEVLSTYAFVAPAERGQGIHTALLHSMLDWAKQAGYIRACTYVRMVNSRAAKTHIRLNWQRSHWPRYVIISSPLLQRVFGLQRKLVISRHGISQRLRLGSRYSDRANQQIGPTRRKI